MNLFALGVASLGDEWSYLSQSIIVNHVMFWGALILGGLIWSAPKKKEENKKSAVDELFD